MQINAAYTGWTGNAGGSSNFYEILIDSKSGVGGTVANSNGQTSVAGVDYILYLYNTGNGSNKEAVGARMWDGSNFASWSPTGGFNFANNADISSDKLTLQWKILQSDITTDFSPWFFAGATRIGGGTDNSAWLTSTDITGTASTPIPSAAWLLGSGVIGLIALKRRNRKTA